MPKMIVFLGNPGVQYKHTRHNAGWMVCDALTEKNSVCQTWTTKFHSLYLKDGNLILLKPQTFMNESGIAVQEAAKFYGINPDSILIVHDDIELPFGTVKMQLGGGMGGHNGLRSIKTHLGTEAFCRLRIGVGRPPAPIAVADFVLGRFTPVEENSISKVLNEAVEKANQFTLKGIE